MFINPIFSHFFLLFPISCQISPFFESSSQIVLCIRFRLKLIYVTPNLKYCILFLPLSFKTHFCQICLFFFVKIVMLFSNHTLNLLRLFRLILSHRKLIPLTSLVFPNDCHESFHLLSTYFLI